MEKCKFCRAICVNAGTDKDKVCTQFIPVRTCFIETEKVEAFPERVVVRSPLSGDERVFVSACD